MSCTPLSFLRGCLRNLKILAISGSLRAASLNTLLLRAVRRLAPPGMQIELFAGLGDLPIFNPDREADAPDAVKDFRKQLLAVEGVLIASPEYAHGVTGGMKNALDWMVGNETFVDKPVALLNASPRATHAQAALREILTTMSARVIEEACMAVPLLGSKLNEDEIVVHELIAADLSAALHKFGVAIASGYGDSPWRTEPIPNSKISRSGKSESYRKDYAC